VGASCAGFARKGPGSDQPQGTNPTEESVISELQSYWMPHGVHTVVHSVSQLCLSAFKGLTTLDGTNPPSLCAMPRSRDRHLSRPYDLRTGEGELFHTPSRTPAISPVLRTVLCVMFLSARPTGDDPRSPGLGSRMS